MVAPLKASLTRGAQLTPLMNTKQIDFDITVESEPRLDLPLAQAALLSASSAPLEESITKVASKLTQIVRTQRYFRTWENRGFALVKGTQ